MRVAGDQDAACGHSYRHLRVAFAVSRCCLQTSSPLAAAMPCVFNLVSPCDCTAVQLPLHSEKQSQRPVDVATARLGVGSRCMHPPTACATFFTESLECMPVAICLTAMGYGVVRALARKRGVTQMMYTRKILECIVP
jgi:hypothetical protein